MIISVAYPSSQDTVELCSVSDLSGLIEKMTCLNNAFLFIKEQLDTSTPIDQAILYIASGLSQPERKTNTCSSQKP